ncbi:MAG: N-acetylmuramoyl-L-alanine amidase, partial [Candidatus Baltobacteraceae bacterium]
RNAALFVSIHVNAFTDSEPHGATIYYFKPQDLALSEAINRRIASEVTALQNDGVRKGKYYVIHHASMPAALIEAGFLTNPADRAVLTSPDWQQRMAVAIADGIKDYTNSLDSASANQ